MQNSFEDISTNDIEISSTIVNRASNSHGMEPFHANDHPPSAIMPTTGVSSNTLPCFGFEASQTINTVAINQYNDPFQQSACSTVSCIATTGVPSRSWDTLIEQVVKAILRCKLEGNWTWLEGLHPDIAAKLVDILTEAVGINPKAEKLDPSSYLGGKYGYIMESIQRLREKMNPADLDTESMPHLIGSRKAASVGNSNSSKLAHCCEEDSRRFVELFQGDSNNDSNPSPQDALLLPVPSPIPQEIRALIDAYIFGQPLTVIVSNERLNEHWALHLPREYGYVMMGFYRIIGVEVRRHDALTD